MRTGFFFTLSRSVRFNPQEDMSGENLNLENFLSVNDVAKRYGIDSKTVYRLAHKGGLPAFKIGSQWRFSEDKLKEWEAEQDRGF